MNDEIEYDLSLIFINDIPIQKGDIYTDGKGTYVKIVHFGGDTFTYDEVKHGGGMYYIRLEFIKSPRKYCNLEKIYTNLITWIGYEELTDPQNIFTGNDIKFFKFRVPTLKEKIKQI